MLIGSSEGFHPNDHMKRNQPGQTYTGLIVACKCHVEPLGIYMALGFKVTHAGATPNSLAAPQTLTLMVQWSEIQSWLYFLLTHWESIAQSRDCVTKCKEVKLLITLPHPLHPSLETPSSSVPHPDEPVCFEVSAFPLSQDFLINRKSSLCCS